MSENEVAINALYSGGELPNLSAGEASNLYDYWCALIGEDPAAVFLDVSTRTIQGFRYRGGGPVFVRISARCVKYRRIDLRR